MYGFLIIFMVKLTDLPLPAHLHGITLELEDSCSLLGKITVAGSEESTDFVYTVLKPFK